MKTILTAACVLWIALVPLHAQTIDQCNAIADDDKRVECYHNAPQKPVASPDDVKISFGDAPTTLQAAETYCIGGTSILARHGELIALRCALFPQVRYFLFKNNGLVRELTKRGAVIDEARAECGERFGGASLEFNDCLYARIALDLKIFHTAGDRIRQAFAAGNIETLCFGKADASVALTKDLNRVIIPLELNGKPGEGIFDTGATMNMTTAPVRARHGLTPTNRISEIFGVEKSVGKRILYAGKLAVGAAKSISGYFVDNNGEFDPNHPDAILVSFSNWLNRPILIDFRNRAFEIVDRKDCGADDRTYFGPGTPLRIDRHAGLHANVTINGREFDALIDTGSATSFVTPEVAEEIGVAPSDIIGRNINWGIEHIPTESKIFKAKSVSLAGLDFQSKLFRIRSLRRWRVVIGLNVLNEHAAYIDMPHKMIYFLDRRLSDRPGTENKPPVVSTVSPAASQLDCDAIRNTTKGFQLTFSGQYNLRRITQVFRQPNGYVTEISSVPSQSAVLKSISRNGYQVSFARTAAGQKQVTTYTFPEGLPPNYSERKKNLQHEVTIQREPENEKRTVIRNSIFHGANSIDIGRCKFQTVDYYSKITDPLNKNILPIEISYSPELKTIVKTTVYTVDQFGDESIVVDKAIDISDVFTAIATD